MTDPTGTPAKQLTLMAVAQLRETAWRLPAHARTGDDDDLHAAPQQRGARFQRHVATRASEFLRVAGGATTHPLYPVWSEELADPTLTEPLRQWRVRRLSGDYPELTTELCDRLYQRQIWVELTLRADGVVMNHALLVGAASDYDPDHPGIVLVPAGLVDAQRGGYRILTADGRWSRTDVVAAHALRPRGGPLDDLLAGLAASRT